MDKCYKIFIGNLQSHEILQTTATNNVIEESHKPHWMKKKRDLKENVWFHFYNIQNQLTKLQARIIKEGDYTERKTEEGISMVVM